VHRGDQAIDARHITRRWTVSSSRRSAQPGNSQKAALAISDPNFKWIDKSKAGRRRRERVDQDRAAAGHANGVARDRLGLDPKKSRGAQMRRETRKSKFEGLLGFNSASTNLKN